MGLGGNWTRIEYIKRNTVTYDVWNSAIIDRPEITICQKKTTSWYEKTNNQRHVCNHSKKQDQSKQQSATWMFSGCAFWFNLFSKLR